MKWLKQIVIYSPLMLFAACLGPAIPQCVILEDLKRSYCIPFKKGDPEFIRPIKAGDYEMTPDEKGTLMRWIENHKK